MQVENKQNSFNRCKQQLKMIHAANINKRCIYIHSLKLQTHIGIGPRRVRWPVDVLFWFWFGLVKVTELWFWYSAVGFTPEFDWRCPKGQDHLPIPMLNSLLCLSSEWLSYGLSKIQLCREMSKKKQVLQMSKMQNTPTPPKKNKIMFHQSWYWPLSLFEQNYAQWPPYPPPTICLCLTVTADTLQALQDRSVRIQAWNLSNPAVSQGYPTSPPLMSLSTALKNWNNLVNNKSAPSSPLNSPPPTH